MRPSMKPDSIKRVGSVHSEGAVMTDESSTGAAAEGRRGPYTVEALAKGLRVLSLFTERQPVWRLRDISQATGIPTPTAFRIIATLVEEGFLEQLEGGDYRPDVRVLTL